MNEREKRKRKNERERTHIYSHISPFIKQKSIPKPNSCFKSQNPKVKHPKN